MATAAHLRARIEATLSDRVPAAFSLKIRQAAELLATGIATADAMLEGGVPRGSITEISGAASTGRTSLALSILSGVTRSGAACAWVDVHDALSPKSAAAAGIVLERLLWLRAKPMIVGQENGPAQTGRSPVVTAQGQSPVIHRGGGSPHPRNEIRGIAGAVSLLFKGEDGLPSDKAAGAPGRSNQSLSGPRRAGAEPLPRLHHQERIACDRLKEIGESKQPEPQQVDRSEGYKNGRPEKPWSRLDQSLRATDLLLQTGGFAAIVLDMGDLPPQQTMRIPLSHWYRFRLATEQARTALILLTQSPCASSCAALALRCDPAGAEAWSADGETSLFAGLPYTLIRERNRNEGSAGAPKKPPARAAWRAETEWTRMR